MRFYSIHIFLITAIFAFVSSAVDAQSPAVLDDTDVQSWHDVQLSLGLNRSVDLFAGGTIWFGKDISRIQEEKGAFGVNFKLSPKISFAPYFSIQRSRNSLGTFVPEKRINLRLTYKFPYKKFGLTTRANYEYRFRKVGSNWRVGTSVTVEKAIPQLNISGLKLFATEEPFYVSLRNSFSRNRLSFGVTKSVNQHLSLDIYYMRQDDSVTHPALIHAIGTSWKIKL